MKQAPSIAALYLARKTDGPDAFSRFIESYRRNPAGAAHDLVVLYKGFDGPADRGAAKQIFSVPHIGLDFPDEGYDIGSYLRAAERLAHETLVCMNTHAEIAAPDWLIHLTAPLRNEGVSLVGAMGSYESVFDSVRMGEAVAWQWHDFRETVTNTDTFEARFAPMIGRRAPPPVVPTARRRAAMIVKRQLLTRGNPAWAWRMLTLPGMPHRWLSQFPSWPNPHIRSNGFAIRTNTLRRFSPQMVRTKHDALHFESGSRGLTATLAREGRVLVADRNGATYDIADWPKSRTFRLGDQLGLLLTDNQSRSFDEMAPECRETYHVLTWRGPYLY